MISFDNTEIAFQSLSNSDLRKASYLFKLLASPTLTGIGSTLTRVANDLRFPIRWIVKPTIYNQFCGGETIAECYDKVRRIEKFRVKAILDYSVEGREDESDIEAALQETLKTIENASQDPNVAFAVFKPTAFTKNEVLIKLSENQPLTETELAEAGKFRNRIESLCKKSAELNVSVLIDAEDTFYQNAIDEVVDQMMAKYNKERAVVYNTFQMYRWDRLDFLKKSHEKARAGKYFLGAKFVRGAYMEKERERARKLGYPSPIQPDKDSTDRDYNKALEYCIQNIDGISVFNGTHNEYSCKWLMELMEKHNLKPGDHRVFTSQLYGMSDNISFNMAQAGYNVAKYIPYGPVKHVIPYLIRRAQENTSVAGQTTRELLLITKELKRRGMA